MSNESFIYDEETRPIEIVPKHHVDKIIAEKDAEIERLKAKIHSLECSLSSAGNLLEHQNWNSKETRRNGE